MRHPRRTHPFPAQARAAHKAKHGSSALQAKVDAARRAVKQDTRDLVLGQANRAAAGVASTRRRTDEVDALNARAEESRRRLEEMRSKRDAPLRTTAAKDDEPRYLTAAGAARAEKARKDKARRRAERPSRPRSPTRVKPNLKTAAEVDAHATLDMYWKQEGFDAARADSDASSDGL